MSYKNKRGFALLFSILISGLLITIGISIFNISIKELMISASIRDSQIAYYAADSATECFSYWDTVSDYFNYCETSPCSREAVISCNGNTVVINELEDNHFYSNEFVRFSQDSSDMFEPTASINLSKTKEDGSVIINGLFSGYNTGENGRRVERSYRRIISN